MKLPFCEPSHQGNLLAMLSNHELINRSQVMLVLVIGMRGCEWRKFNDDGVIIFEIG